MEKYKYYLLHRPLDIGTVPSGFIESNSFEQKQKVMENGVEAWGTVTYDRKLTQEEITKFELLEEITEEKKQETINDIMNLKLLDKYLDELSFNEKSLKSLMGKISEIVNKEILKQRMKNNVSIDKINNEIDNNVFVKLNKREAINFYADKIILDCIKDCSENNRIFKIDEYKNNAFVSNNFSEIVKKMNWNEKINDMEVDYEKKEIDFVFYLEYCPQCYQENLNVSNNERLDLLEEFEGFMKDWKAVVPLRWFRSNTREVINQFYYSRCKESQDKDIVYNVINEELNKIGFIDKYIDGDTVGVNGENLDELISDLSERVNQLKDVILEEKEEENG